MTTVFDYAEIDPNTKRIIRQPRRTVIPENSFIEPGDMRVDAGRFFYYVKASAAALLTPELRRQIEARFTPTVSEQPAEQPVLMLNEAALAGGTGEPSEDTVPLTAEADETDG